MSALADRVLDLACAIQQIPAPTFQEHQRAEFIRDQFHAAGLDEVHTDDTGNVYARRPGGEARPIIVSAHLDTVFPAGADLTLTRTPDRIAGPGIGDNSLGVAGLLGLAWALDTDRLPAEIWLVANVCEEGLGDLRGMRRVAERFGEQVRAYVVLEGMSLGHIYHAAVGVRRYRFMARAEGGHSWQHFGRPSAIHALLPLAAEITRLEVPRTPKTTFNIGTIGGGTTINSIAREAAFDLDLRSEDPAALDALAARVEALAASAAAEASASIETIVIGHRPAGALPRTHPLVQRAIRAHTEAGVLRCTFEPGSTDANIPLSRGWPALTVGLTTGGNSHRPDEYIDTAPLRSGLKALELLVRGIT